MEEAARGLTREADASSAAQQQPLHGSEVRGDGSPEGRETFERAAAVAGVPLQVRGPVFAVIVLGTMLADGPLEVKELYRIGRERFGLSPYQLREGRKRLPAAFVRTGRPGPTRRTYWRLPRGAKAETYREHGRAFGIMLDRASDVWSPEPPKADTTLGPDGEPVPEGWRWDKRSGWEKVPQTP